MTALDQDPLDKILIAVFGDLVMGAVTITAGVLNLLQALLGSEC